MTSLRTAILLALCFVPALPACTLENGQVEDEGVTAEADDELSITRGRFESFVGKDGQHYFHLLAGNGEKVLASEGYVSAANAEAGIRSVQENGRSVEAYELREAKSGEWYFVLKAGNGRVIGVSETYATKSNAERAVATVAKIVGATVARGTAPEGAPKFQVFRGIDKQYYFHLRANNGQIVLQSEGYVARSSATNGTASVQQNGAIRSRYALLEAANGQWYFVLKASNGQVIARGETYASKWNAERGIQTCIELLSGSVSTGS